ncbi:unnamed protein product [Staurois parvus]|uniref:C-type lectin domain-containing protein n=1 Tax=Staurois parvus TaxID=386267 RepID=A0ABN9FW30_9NEOB|nr:unnamed protein product [Staurois parvus]
MVIERRSARRQIQSRCPVCWKRPLCIGVIAAIIAVILIVVAVVICRATSPVHENLFCPDKWTRHGRTCYFVSKNATVWKSAQEYCKEEGGSLLVMDNTSQRHIEELFTLKEDHWIGLRKVNEEWKWIDGSVYTGQVKHDVPQMDCAYFNGGIGALECSSQRSWICMKSL